MPVSAQIVLDSISPEGIRLTTFKIRYPKMVHGDFMTHRVFSRNASSSRAIPTSKYIEEVLDGDLRAKPSQWGINKKGMQAAEVLSDADALEAEKIWAQAARNAADSAVKMMQLNVHKQVINRLMEPFIHINTVVSATEWDNFYGLRLDEDADPTIQELAKRMWIEHLHSAPKKLDYEQWHLPFVYPEEYKITHHEQRVKISIARCARTSYLSFETGKVSTIKEDLDLYEKLVGRQPVHASPAEHQATPISKIEEGLLKRHELSNLVGWKQYRKMIPGEACAPLPQKFKELY